MQEATEEMKRRRDGRLKLGGDGTRTRAQEPLPDIRAVVWRQRPPPCHQAVAVEVNSSVLILDAHFCPVSLCCLSSLESSLLSVDVEAIVNAYVNCNNLHILVYDAGQD